MRLALRGLRNLDDGDQPLPDQQDVRRQVQRQARRVWLKTGLATAAVTASTLVLLLLRS